MRGEGSTAATERRLAVLDGHPLQARPMVLDASLRYLPETATQITETRLDVCTLHAAHLNGVEDEREKISQIDDELGMPERAPHNGMSPT